MLKKIKMKKDLILKGGKSVRIEKRGGRIMSHCTLVYNYLKPVHGGYFIKSMQDKKKFKFTMQ